jgi:hydrogenase maturation factor HypF (carbamoyltransferase family)
VGVMSENEAPDVYFCEECRPDLHELGSRNQGYPFHLSTLFPLLSLG